MKFNNDNSVSVEIFGYDINVNFVKDNDCYTEQLKIDYQWTTDFKIINDTATRTSAYLQIQPDGDLNFYYGQKLIISKPIYEVYRSAKYSKIDDTVESLINRSCSRAIPKGTKATEIFENAELFKAVGGIVIQGVKYIPDYNKITSNEHIKFSMDKKGNITWEKAADFTKSITKKYDGTIAVQYSDLEEIAIFKYVGTNRK